MINHFRYLVLLILFSFILGCAKEGSFDPNLKNKQDALSYLDVKTANKLYIPTQEQQKLYQNFLNRYYSPWTGKNLLFSMDEIKTYQENQITALLLDPGWNENKHQHTLQWAQQIINNMDMGTYPNHIAKAITLTSVNLRQFPTDQVSFSTLDQQGWTYPFDNMQESFEPSNLPVLILQTTKDKAWDLILTNSAFSWVKANTLGLVDLTFIDSWQKVQGYITVDNDHTSIIDKNNIFRFKTRMGAIYPIAKTTNQDFEINIAIADANGNATITTALIKKTISQEIPMQLTEKNIAIVANRFLGNPYGWGGMYGYRDCSATTKDIMANFAIWLPRNSAQQAILGGKMIDLTQLSTKQKQKIIAQQGVPYLSLVHLPGHVMLYLGEKNGTLYVLHNMWGLRTSHLFKPDGRAVVGKTVITPIDFGKKYVNVKKSLLDSVTSLTLLN